MTSSETTGTLRTIDRRIVHRSQVHEVFITDVEEGKVGWFSAQLPSSHSYYCDALSVPRVLVDALALMEACRQASTAAAHLSWDVSFDSQFILTSCRGHFPVASRPRFGDGPIDLRLQVSLTEARFFRSELTGGTSRIRIDAAAADGSSDQIGMLDLDIRYVRKATYDSLRSRRRPDTPVPTSAALTSDPHGASPREVGRSREDNVVIGPAIRTATGGETVLRLPFHNRSMFDHPQDHAPAMVLVEAARQLVHSTFIEASFDHWVLVGVEGQFDSYVELDQPTTLRVTRRATLEGDSRPVTDIEVHQLGKLAASLVLSFGFRSGDTSKAELS